MSQRLLISKKERVTYQDSFYDCIYTEDRNWENLLFEWCCYDPLIGVYLGPWKIRIRDYDFFDQFMEDFIEMKEFTPTLQSLDDVWMIWDTDGSLIHEKEMR